MAKWLPILRRLLALVMVSTGLGLLYAALWVAYRSILPQWRDSGWSLSDRSMILNRVWQGNQLYLLVLLYAGLGLAVVVWGVRVWRGTRRISSRTDSESASK
jgi:hypothetical protein